ncbi:MAG: hypothetical protein Q8O19_03105 [Rectinemataceae bacterium]|nr:hypothetical protein [Rectinemataceae bacterium]
MEIGHNPFITYFVCFMGFCSVAAFVMMIFSFGTYGIIPGIILSAILGSPIYYEFPSFFERSVVVEQTSDNHYVEHPWGAFSWEGDDRFHTMPSKNSATEVLSHFRSPTEEQPKRLLMIQGYLTINDYGKILTLPEEYLQGNVDASEVMDFRSALRNFAQDCLNELVRNSVEIQMLYSTATRPDLQQLQSLMEQELNQQLAQYGVKYEAKAFGFRP